VSAKTVTVAARLGFAVLGLAVATAAFGTQSTDHAGHGAAAAPAAAPPAAAVAAPVDKDEATITKGRELFANWGCESCHALGDAGAAGHVGPAFDGNPNMTKEFIVNRVTNGQGAMPAFGGQMTDEEIGILSEYIAMVAQK
jgi:mono/diheme cytochrome c family protein